MGDNSRVIPLKAWLTTGSAFADKMSLFKYGFTVGQGEASGSGVKRPPDEKSEELSKDQRYDRINAIMDFCNTGQMVDHGFILMTLKI